MTPLPVFTGRERFMVTLLIPTRARATAYFVTGTYIGQSRLTP